MINFDTGTPAAVDLPLSVVACVPRSLQLRLSWSALHRMRALRGGRRKPDATRFKGDLRLTPHAPHVPPRVARTAACLLIHACDAALLPPRRRCYTHLTLASPRWATSTPRVPPHVLSVADSALACVPHLTPHIAARRALYMRHNYADALPAAVARQRPPAALHLLPRDPAGIAAADGAAADGAAAAANDAPLAQGATAAWGAASLTAWRGIHTLTMIEAASISVAPPTRPRFGQDAAKLTVHALAATRACIAAVHATRCVRRIALGEVTWPCMHALLAAWPRHRSPPVRLCLKMASQPWGAVASVGVASWTAVLHGARLATRAHVAVSVVLCDWRVGRDGPPRARAQLGAIKLEWSALWRQPPPRLAPWCAIASGCCIPDA